MSDANTSGKFLAGKVAVVTGGARGIGAAISRQLAAAGAAVLVNYAKSADAAKRIQSLDGGDQAAGDSVEIVTSSDICAASIIRHLSGSPRGTVAVIDYLQILDHNREKPALGDQIAALQAFARKKPGNLRLHHTDRSFVRPGAGARARAWRHTPAQPDRTGPLHESLLPARRQDPVPGPHRSTRSMNQRVSRVQTSSFSAKSSTPCSRLGLSLTSIRKMPSQVSFRSTP